MIVVHRLENLSTIAYQLSLMGQVESVLKRDHKKFNPTLSQGRLNMDKSTRKLVQKVRALFLRYKMTYQFKIYTERYLLETYF